MKKVITLIAAAVLASVTSVFAQNIQTASDFFKNISDYYATIKDYEAQIEIKAPSGVMRGKVSFKRPEMLRIDFTSPAEQVILFNGDDLTIYLPNSAAILEQHVENSAANASSAAGLTLLRRYYSIAYEIGQDPVPLDDESDEQVVKLILYHRSSSEAFNTIKIAILPGEKLIRRVEAITPKNETYIFNFSDYNLNTNISDQRFIYEAPSSANNYNNFLFTE